MTLPASSAKPSFGLFIAGLSITQIISWGTTFYLPSILERQIGRDLGLGREVIFGGITVMLVVAALIGPRIGGYIDRNGTSLTMLAGCLLLSAGLCLVGVSTGPVSYLAGWALFGLAVPLSMSIAAFAAVAQAYPERGRAGITTLMLFGGLSSGIIWPLTGWLELQFGWRVTCLIYAGLQLGVCLPLKFLLTRAQRAEFRLRSLPADRQVVEPLLLPRDRSAAFWLLVLGSGVSGLVSWGLPLYFVTMFIAGGLETGHAIILASVQAYFTVLARVVDLGVAGRVGGMRLVSAASLLSPLCFLMLIVGIGMVTPGSGSSSPWQIAVIGIGMALYGFATGMIAAGRATLPLELFGSGGYAGTLGKLSLWLNLMFAASPVLFAFLYDGLGQTTTLWVAMAGDIVAAIAYWRLDALVQEGRRGAAG
jgi:MFS family permease